MFLKKISKEKIISFFNIIKCDSYNNYKHENLIKKKFQQFTRLIIFKSHNLIQLNNLKNINTNIQQQKSIINFVLRTDLTKLNKTTLISPPDKVHLKLKIGSFKLRIINNNNSNTSLSKT